MRETTKTRALFDRFVSKFEAYEGQICISTKTFRRELMIPTLNRMKALEKKADE